MPREEVKPPRELANEHTLVAQRYAGYFVGHPYRNQQQNTIVTVERKHWREPAIVADGCLFCVRLTDEDAVRRVAGFQHQIDIEVCRLKHRYLVAWVEAGGPDVPVPGRVYNGAANMRRFCELFQDMPTEKRPNGWKTRPLPLVDLPLRLKRKLCIEWHHLYLPWMTENGLQYDFEKHVFWHEVSNECPSCAVTLAPDAAHADGCGVGVAGPIFEPVLSADEEFMRRAEAAGWGL